jgi:hypothetical protein
MTKIRMTAAAIVVALVGLTLTGAALAGKPAPGERPGKAAFCKRLDHMIEMKQNAGNRLEKVAAKIQARIDNADLTPRQEARAQKLLARIQALIAKLDARAARLQAAYDKHCATA